jgi:UDP-glucose 4-epimerase
MKAVVTGGAGFIGSHLVDALLAEGHSVTVLDNFSTGRPENLAPVKDKIKIVECDLSRPGAWAEHLQNADFVFHLAALADIVPSIQNPVSYYEANVQGTLNLMEACRHFSSPQQKFIYAASSSCYGIPEVYPTSESSPIRPQYPYALTKYLGEQLALHWGQVYHLPVLALRFFNVYGPRSRTSGTYGAVFGVFLAQKLAQRPFTVVGDGTQTRDFTFVSDVVRAILAAAKSSFTNDIYNVGSGKTVSVNRIVELLGGDKIFIPRRPGEPDCTFADISKIRRDLAWEPRVSVEEGVAELIKNIEYWRNAPLWDPNSIAEQTRDWFKYLGRQAS